MQYKIRLLSDLGEAVRAARKASGMTAAAIAARSGRARSVIYRIESGEDITTESLLDILRAVGMTIRLEPLGMPSLEEVRRRFPGDDDDS